MGLKVKFRLCHFSAVQETTQTFTAPKGPADPADTHTGSTEQEHTAQTQTGSGETPQTNPHLDSHPAA